MRNFTFRRKHHLFRARCRHSNSKIIFAVTQVIFQILKHIETNKTLAILFQNRLKLIRSSIWIFEIIMSIVIPNWAVELNIQIFLKQWQITFYWSFRIVLSQLSLIFRLMWGENKFGLLHSGNGFTGDAANWNGRYISISNFYSPISWKCYLWREYSSLALVIYFVLCLLFFKEQFFFHVTSTNCVLCQTPVSWARMYRANYDSTIFISEKFNWEINSS